MLSHLSSLDSPPEVTLDFGSEGVACGPDAIEMTGCGMRFRAARAFEVGTTLEVSVREKNGFDEPPLDIEAMVVDCKKIAARCYETVLWFLDGIPSPGPQHADAAQS